MSTNFEIIEQEKKTLEEELKLLARSFELDLEKNLMELKAKALKEGLLQSVELKKLEQENEILRIKSSTAKKIDELKTERIKLELENASDEEKTRAREMARLAHNEKVEAIRKKYNV